MSEVPIPGTEEGEEKKRAVPSFHCRVHGYLGHPKTSLPLDLQRTPDLLWGPGERR